MHKTFSTFDALYAEIRADKESRGADSSHRDRYPVRFVLFENFADYSDFVEGFPGSIYQHSLDRLVEPGYPDTLVSYTALADEICAKVGSLPASDYILCPFSEMARFYSPREFESLVKTVRLRQSPAEAQETHTRFYIPVVGMQGRMSPFFDDIQTFVYEFSREPAARQDGGGDGESTVAREPEEAAAYGGRPAALRGDDGDGAGRGLYNLVITDGTTYGVAGLERDYSVVNDMEGWVSLWTKGGEVKKNIICCSRSIFTNAHYAQPDNAFTYVECRDAREFLTKGLKLDFGAGAETPAEETGHWEQLAAQVDARDFDFDAFAARHFGIRGLRTGLDFVKAWGGCASESDCWLLKLYYSKCAGGKGYVSRALSRCASLSTQELFSHIATAIFDTPATSADIEERHAAMRQGAAMNVVLPEAAERRLEAKLKAMAANPAQGVREALRFLTPLSGCERRLAIQWVGQGRVRPAEMEHVFPDLYHYLAPLPAEPFGRAGEWVRSYFDAYRMAKIADAAGDEVEEALRTHSADTSAFRAWKDSFRTVRTVLHDRRDIDVYYWIDGLGVDWIPFVIHVISEFSKENVYLNEVHVAAALLPTTTAENKPVLESLLPEGAELPKVGDIDSFAHRHKQYPQYIADEMAMVRDAVRKALVRYNGRKIAFVSDHGLTYLAQFAGGRGIAGIEGDHEGRLARAGRKVMPDRAYFVLDDGKTVCALTHASLTGKVARGHGAHGGCTPEELLVPVFVVSSQKNASNYSVEILSRDVEGYNPVVEFRIRGLNSADTPVVEYGGMTYALTETDDGIYRSERLVPSGTATGVTLKIGDTFRKDFPISISTGSREEDPFDL